jgi:hypothetical protein
MLVYGVKLEKDLRQSTSFCPWGITFIHLLAPKPPETDPTEEAAAKQDADAKQDNEGNHPVGRLKLCATKL